ncbi:MAG: glycosyltransferase family 4 protein [Chloroflexi bacterium]|nr:glycosyltransferase family 4 protein [Chloroflexota bacterium]
MRIAQVCPYDYTYPGGVVSHISYLKHHLVGLGHEVKIIAPCTNGRKPYMGEEITCLGMPLPIPSSGSIARCALSPRLFRSVELLFQKEEFDIVHVHEPFTPTLTLAAMLKSRSVTVGTFHACHAKPRAYWLAKPILTRWLPRLHGKIAVSKPALDFVSRHLPGEYITIPNGIDTHRFSAGIAPLPEFQDNKLNILFVGRLEKRKGFDCLLKAYAAIRRQSNQVRLIIVGPGTRLRAKYEDEVAKEGIRDIAFVGYVPQEELPRYYATADLFCAPATGGESFGIVLLEAMASGKPIVATNIAGYSSVMTNNVEGILFPPRDHDACAQAITSLIRSPELREKIGQAGRKTAEGFSWEIVTRKVVDLYQELLNERRV